MSSRDHLWISPDHRRWFSDEMCRSLRAMTEAFGIDYKAHRKRTKVTHKELAAADGAKLGVYFKLYATASRRWDGLARRSRGVMEARNLMNFSRWGIRAPSVLAWGYRRREKGLCSDRSFIITQAVPEARELREYWVDRDVPESEAARLQIIDQLARQARTLHRHGFFHQDLKWRNVLVGSGGEVTWIDCPNGYFSKLPPRQHHGRVKDLATLDKVAVDRCSEDERRRFLGIYLDTDDEKLIDRWAGDVVRYRRRRQD